MDAIPTFGAWLKRRRKALDLTQAALARLVACSVVSIRKFEGDEQRPSRELAARLAECLAIPPAERATFIQYARMGLDAAPPALPLPAAAELPVPGRGAVAPREQFQFETTAHLAAPQPDQPALVGRPAEWRQLQAIWQDAGQGRAQVVMITGEAGIGKTRLAEELLRFVEEHNALAAHAQTYAAAGRLPYAPLVAWLRTPALRRRLERLNDADYTEVARLLPDLLGERPGLSPPGPVHESWQRVRMFEALARAALAGRRPLLLVLNDLQWCDQETLDWLHFLLRYAPQAQLLVLVTVRAEESGVAELDLWRQSLVREEQVTVIDLQPLDEQETIALAQQLADGALGAAHANHLFQQTEGNPLFVVELVRAELNTRRLGRSVEQAALVQPAMLPARMQAVLQTRLSQLSPAAGELVSLAAVAGRAFVPEVLAAASDQHEHAVVAGLDELWQRRILREQDDGAYDFSHDKLREVAYAALSPARRRLLHRRVAQALEQSAPDTLDALSAQIAAHYEQAGRAEQAIPYYRRGAAAAHRLGAFQEASHCLERGLALLRRLPPSAANLQHELEMQVDLALMFALLTGFATPETEQAYDRALALAQRVERTPQLFPILWGLHEVYLFQAKGVKARATAEQCMELAQQLGDPALLLQAHHASWPVVAQFFPDEMLVAVAHIEAGLALYDPTQHRRMMLEYGGHDPSICAHQAASKLFWLLGYPEKGLGHGIQAIETAKEIGYPFGIAVALNNVSAMYIYRREFAVAAALAAESAVICEQQHFSLILAETQIFHGMAVAMQGELAVGLEELQQGIADWTALGTTLGIPLHQILLADVYLAAGEPHAALAAADQAIAASAIEGYLEAEAHRLRGAALLAVGAAEAQAEAAFERAIAIAQRQSARSLELRAAVSLAQLWRQQGNAAEARRLLEPIYSWFTEGFDTVDLRAARALLDALM